MLVNAGLSCVDESDQVSGRRRDGANEPVAARRYASFEADAQTEAALLALVRLLARQAAREVFDAISHELGSFVEEGRE